MIVRPTIALLNPTDDLQAAVDATPTGGILRLGTGTFTAPSGGLQINKPLEFCGSGYGTVIQPFADADYMPVIVIGGEGGIYIHDLRILGLGSDVTVPTARASCEGIRIHTASGQGTITNVRIERVQVRNIPSNEIDVSGYNGAADAVIAVRIRDCDIHNASGHGVYMRNCTISSVENTYISSCGLTGLFTVDYAEVHVTGCTFENNCRTDTVDNATTAQCCLNQCHVTNVTACHFESFNTASQPRNKIGLLLSNCNGVLVSGCMFLNGISVAATVGIKVTSDAGVRSACHIMPCTHAYVYTPVSVGADVVGVSVWWQDITNDGAAGVQPTRGVTLPYFATASKPAAQAALKGQMFYDPATDSIWICNGAAWKSVALT